MTNDEARRYFENLYALPYEKAYERLRNDAPGLDRSDLLPLLLRVPYIPERLPMGSVAEKNHAMAAEALLGQALNLMGFNAFVLRRHDDCPDVAAFSREHGYSLIADAKCMRLSRSGVQVKDLKVVTVSSWRQYIGFNSAEDFVPGLHFAHVQRLGPSRWRFEVEHTVGLCGIRLTGEDLEKGMTERCANAGLLVLPFRNLPARSSRVYTECCKWDVTLLPWEYLYALTALGITESEGLSLDDAWHISYAIRSEQDDASKWSLGHMPREDKLLAAVVGKRTGQLRDQIATAVEAMLARADEEVASLPTKRERLEQLRKIAFIEDPAEEEIAETRRLLDLPRLPERILAAKRFAEAWLEKRERK